MASWTACVVGELEFPIDAVAAWTRRSADPSAYPRWPFPKALPAPARVSSMLDAIVRFPPREPPRVVITPTRVRVRGAFSGETAYWCQTLALALREGAAVGARGKITFVDATEPPPEPPLHGEVFELELDGARSTFTKLRGAASLAVRANAEVHAAVLQVIGADRAMAAPDVGPTAAAVKRAELTGDLAATALRKAVRTPLRTFRAALVGKELVARILADPTDRGERALRDAWSALAGRKKSRPDFEHALRVSVGNAVLRLAKGGKRNDDWPDERKLRAAVERVLRET